MRACRRHTELSRNVPPFLTLQSAKKDPSAHSEYTPSHTDTPFIRSYSLNNEVEAVSTGKSFLYPIPLFCTKQADRGFATLRLCVVTRMVLILHIFYTVRIGEERKFPSSPATAKITKVGPSCISDGLTRTQEIA